MDADQLIIAIRRIIVRGGSTLDILRFLDDATEPPAPEKPAVCATCGARRLDSGCYTSQPCEDCWSDPLDEPLGQACKIDDPDCEACS